MGVNKERKKEKVRGGEKAQYYAINIKCQESIEL